MNKKVAHREFQGILQLIVEAQQRVYAQVNAELVLLYLNVGKIVSSKVSDGNWGESTVQALADFIASKMPHLSGFNRRGLYRMKQFYDTYNDQSPCFLLWAGLTHKIVSALPTQIETSLEKVLPHVTQNKASAKKKLVHAKQNKSINQKVSPLVTLFEKKTEQFIRTMLCKVSWTNHLLILSKTQTDEEKLYYLAHSITEKLSKRELERHLNTGHYQRTSMSNKSLKQFYPNLPQNLFKDPYIFEFLNLPESYNEKDFEQAITHNLQKFILEIGKDFTYMGRQYRLQVGKKDYYTDLLFYHRGLQCLVLFELKIQDFEPEFLGKLNFYLEVLDREVKHANENPSIGILLCKGKDSEVVEYALARNTSPALIAEYEIQLIDKHLLTQKLNQLTEIFIKKQD